MKGTLPRLHLKGGHVKPIWAGHPWVYAQAIGRRDGDPQPGQLVEVVDSEGKHLGRGYFSPESAIPVRLLSRDPAEVLDESALVRRIQDAVELRRRILDLPRADTTGFRLVHAEGDELPGLIVDRYDRVLTVQLLTLGMYQRRDPIFDALATVDGIESIVEIASRDAQRLEHFTTTSDTVRGPQTETLDFTERGVHWRLPLALAQKTGFYFDQRDNRARIETLARGRTVLDLCCYLGGFALAAARGGASEVVAVDRSDALLEQAALQARLNGLEASLTFRSADVRRDLAPWADAGERYGLVILDPPKLSPSGKHRKRALDTYRNLNAAALRLVQPGGLLATCSCSGAVSSDDLLRAVAGAGQRVRRRLRLLELHHQGGDHPTPPAFGEGRYLDCAIFVVD